MHLIIFSLTGLVVLIFVGLLVGKSVTDTLVLFVTLDGLGGWLLFPAAVLAGNLIAWLIRTVRKNGLDEGSDSASR